MTSPDVSTYCSSATASTGVAPCAWLCRAEEAESAAVITRASPAACRLVNFFTVNLLSCQKTVLNQPARAAAPGHVGPHAQVGLPGVDERSGPDVANRV